MQEVIPIMRKQGAGMIININSGVSKRYVPGISAYSSTKYALNAITSIARQELKKENIIVSSVFPKVTLTKFNPHCITPLPDWSSFNGPMPPSNTGEEVAEKIAELIISEAEEIVL